MSKKAPPVPVTAAPRSKPVLPIDLRLAEVRARQRVVILEIVELESRGTIPQDMEDQQSIDADAMRLIDGSEDTSSTPKSRPESKGSAGPRLLALLREREVIEKALVIGTQRQLQAHSDRIRQALLERADEWREIVFQTAQAVVTLRKCNRAREQFRKEMTYAAPPSLVCDGFQLLGATRIVNDDVYRFLQSVVRAGIMSAKDVDGDG
jgi:hypothetical protein